MTLQRERQSQTHLKRIHLLFMELDDPGDGFLNYAEFKEVVSNGRIECWLQAMDIDVRDAEPMFDLLRRVF